MRRTIQRVTFGLLLAGFWCAGRDLPNANAAEFRKGQGVVIAKDETIDDDLYVTCGRLTVDGTIKGDLFCFAGELQINGVVEGDLVAIGQVVVINGPVNDDARIAGQFLKLGPKAEVTGDLLALVFSLECQTFSSIGQDLSVGGYQAELAGSVGRNVQGRVVALRLSGEVDGDLEVSVEGRQGDPAPAQFGPTPNIEVPKVPPGVTLTDTAKIGGDLNYRAPEEADIDDAAEIAGTKNWEQVSPQQQRQGTAKSLVLQHVRRLAALLLVGLFLLLVVRRWTGGLADNVQRRPITSFFLGIVSVLMILFLIVALLVVAIVLVLLCKAATLTNVIPLVVVATFVSEVLLIGGTLIYAVYIALIVVGIAVGRLLVGLALKSQRSARLVPMLIGTVLVVALTAIPYAGWMIGLLFVLLGLGALWLRLSGGPQESTKGFSGT